MRRAMPAQTTVYLIRHAESRPSEDLPEPDWPLSERGRMQASALVDAMRPLEIDILYSSPYERARHTLQPLADALSKPLHIVPDLRERRLTHRGFLGDQFIETLERQWSDPDFALSDGESNNECKARIVRVVGELAHRHPGGTLAVSSHGNAIAMFLQWLDPNFGMDDWRAMRNPDLFRIVYEDTRAVRDGSRLPTAVSTKGA